MAAATDEAAHTSNLSCSICSEAYKSNDEVLCTKCGHVFHKTCFQEWQTRSTTCPECRGERPAIQPIYLHIEDPVVETPRVNTEEELDLVNKVSLLERRLEESEQHFFDTQCLLTFSDEQIEELKNQLEYTTTLNSSYEQEQQQRTEALAVAQQELSICKTQTDELKIQVQNLNEINTSFAQEQIQAREALAEAQQALTLTKRQVDELKKEIEFINVVNSSYEREEKQMKTQIKSLEQALKDNEKNLADILDGINGNGNETNCRCKEMEDLKLQNERKITDLLHQHAVAEGVSEQIHTVLKNQLEMSEDQNKKLRQQIIKLQSNENSNKKQSQNSNQNAEESPKEEIKSENEFILEEKIRRLEAKLKNLYSELEAEVEVSTKLTIENMKLKNIISLPKQYDQEKEKIANVCEKERQNQQSVKGDEFSNKHLLDS